MPKLVFAAIVAALLSLLVSAAQERVKPADPASLPDVLRKAQAAWDAGQYGLCMAQLQEATTLVSEKRRQVILATLPAAPSGWEVVPEKKNAALQNNPMAAAMAGIGNIFKREYKETDGRGRITVAMTTDSPMVQMLNMWIANPAMLGENGELIKYGPHSAVLKNESGGRRLKLTILLLGKHVCEVTASGLDEDGLFAMFDQAAIDRLAAVLAK